MRCFLVGVILFVAAAAPIHADPHNLAGGALIAHYIPLTQYRYQILCDAYYQYDPLSSCADQVNSAYPSAFEWVAWCVVAAFEEEKEWCSVQFGLNDYDPDLISLGFEACFPGGGGMTITSGNWPGPNEGITLIAGETPWSGNFALICTFVGYFYGYSGSGVVQLVDHESLVQPFAGFANCTQPTTGAWNAALGGFGINVPGTWVCWGWNSYVCCVSGECVIVQEEEECIALGGVYHPEWDNCGPPDPCASTPVARKSWGTIKALYR